MRIILTLLLIVFTQQTLAAQQLHFRDLYGRGDSFSDLAQQTQGQRITVRGYMAPPIKAQADFFVLTKMPLSFCPFCESEADWPTDIMYVKSTEVIDILPYNQVIYVTGTLDIGTQTDAQNGFVSRVRLLDARVTKHN